MASNDFINECKNNAYKNRLGTISIKDITKKSGSIITTDEAIEGPLNDYKVFGNTYQKTTDGQQLYDYLDTSTVNNPFTVLDDGWVEFYLNKTSSGTTFYNYFTRPMNLKPNTQYAIVIEFENTTNDYTYTLCQDRAVEQFKGALGALSPRVGITVKKLTTKDNFEGVTMGLRLFFTSYGAHEHSSKFRITVMEDTTVTADTFEYQNFTNGPTPNPNYSQEIISCGDRTKNKFLVPNSPSNSYRATYSKINNNSFSLNYNQATADNSSSYARIDFDITQFKPNTQYTISKKHTVLGDNFTNAGAMRSYINGSNGSVITEDNFSFTTPSEITSLGVYFYLGWNNKVQGTSTITFYDIQIEENSTATPYEPYGKYKIPVNVRSENIYNIHGKSAGSGSVSSEVDIDDNDFISSSYDNINGSNTHYTNVMIQKSPLLQPSTNYLIVCEIESVSGTGSLYPFTRHNNSSIESWHTLYQFSNLSAGQKIIIPVTTKSTLSSQDLRTLVRFDVGQSGSIKFRLSILEDTTITEDTFKYQPYYNQTTNIYLDEPLRKINEYSDYIDFINGKVVRQLGEVILDGNTNALTYYGTYGTYNAPLFYMNKSDLIIPSSYNEKIIFASHYRQYLVNSEGAGGMFNYGIRGATANHRIYIRDDRYNNSNDINDWLSENNVTVDYVLATPTEENIELPNINLIKGKNIITLGTELESIIEVEYTNWENKIKNSDRLQKVTIDNGCIVNNEIIGSVYSKKVTSDILDINELGLENKKIDIKIGVKYDNESHEILNMGKYTIERPKDEQTVNMGQITAYDDLNSKLEDKYICGIDYTQGNKTLRDLYIDLCNQLELTPKNLEFDNNTIPIANNPFTNGEKNRLVLQTIEKVSGTFSDIDNDTNEIDLCWLSNSVEPDYTFYRNDYTNLEGGKIVYGPINCLVIKNSQIDDENVTIKDDESITLNGEHTLTINEDYILYNSELRQLAINAIWNKVHNLTYVDCKLTTLYGKPFLKLGDKIRVYKTDTEYFDTYVLLHNFIYDGSFESTIQSPVLTEQEIKTKQKISLREALKNTEVEVNKQKQTITALVQETSENTEKTSQLQLQSDEINQRIEDSQYYIDEDGNKQTISGSINELKNTAEELNLNLQKIGGLNLMKNSSGQNGTIGYKCKMLKPYIEFQTWNEFNQYISTWSAVNDIYTCFIHVVGEASDSERDCWYGLYYQDGYSRRYYYEQVVWNGNYIYPDKYNFYMDFMYEELFTFVEANYTDTESFKRFLIDYTNEYTNISPNIFSSMTNDFIENSTIAKSAFLLIPTVRDTYTAMDEDYIYGESFTVPSNVNKLYFSVKSKIDGLCGKARLILYQLDDKMDNIQNNLNVYDFWTNHVISETVISIPDNLLNSDSFEEYKREVDILDNTVDILPCFSIGNNFVNDGVYVNFKNPILNPINRFYWKKVWETIDEVSAYYTYRSIHTKKKLQFFESSTVPEIPNTPDFTQLWLCTEDIDTYTKDKLYTPQYEVDNTGTILSKTWISTDYTKEQIENNVEIIMFDGWTYVYSAMGEMDATPRPDMKFLIADCMVSTTDTSWQPASGENYWGKNIKISGDKGIYIYNTVDGYNRIIDEKQDIATDNSGNTLWQLTGKGMKTKRAECESIRLPKLEILCTSDSTAFYHKENEGDDYGA